MFYTLTGALKATGLNKTTILRAIESGKITGTKDLFGEWQIERAGLHRVYPPVAERSAGSDTAQPNAASDAATLESEIGAVIREAGDSLRQQPDDVRRDRHPECHQAQASQRVADRRERRPWWRRITGNSAEDRIMNDERQRLPGQFTDLAAASKISEDPKHVDLWSITPPKNSALEAIQTPIGQQEHFGPSINATQANRGSSQEPGPKSLPIDQIGINIPERVSALDHEIGTRNRGDAQRLRATLTTGALIAALGLGWIGGSSSHHFFGPKQTADSSARTPGSKNETICITSPETGREATPSAPNTRRVVTPTPPRLGRGHESSHGTAQLATASTNPASPVAQQNTASPGAAEVAVQRQAKILSRPRATPTPDTRPTTIPGWTVRDVVGGTVVLEGPDGILKATRGDTVPGVGRVDSIVRWGSRWIVATSRGGLITTP
jgi:hypothetical protein